MQAVSKDTVNAEEIDGYRGDEDLDRILEFIEAKPDKIEEEKTAKSNVAKRNRKSDKKAKRSRTPSAAPSISKETSAERQQVCLLLCPFFKGWPQLELYSIERTEHTCSEVRPGGL